MAERFNGRIEREVLTIAVGSHRDLERLLKGYNQAYNARPQRVLKGSSPDEVVRGKLADAPELANPRHKPPDPGVMAEAMRAVESAKEVSRPDTLAMSVGPARPCGLALASFRRALRRSATT
jgi:hypothetical protein